MCLADDRESWEDSRRVGACKHRILVPLGVLLAGLIAAPAALAVSLLPDIETRPLPTSSSDIQIDGNELLFSNAWENHGQGPWETAPAGPASADDCDGDGSPSNDVIVVQNLFQDANGNGIFERSIDTAVIEHPAGCMVFHPAHDHFHIENAGVYSLLSEPTGAPAASSSKVSFCLLDVDPFDLSMPGAPSEAYYDDCNPSVQGISVGWFDEYHLFLPGQSIDLDGVEPGHYCLRSKFDPENLFTELDEADNVAEQRYFIDPNTEQVTPAGDCVFESPSPPPDSTAPDTEITTGPSGKTQDRTPRFRFRADEPASFECRLDRREWRSCTSPRTYGRKHLGRHKFKVRATDGAGNVEPKPAKQRFRIVAKK